MPDFTIRAYTTADLETFRALVTHPDVAEQFDKFQGPHGLEFKLSDENLDQAGIRLAFLGDEPVGFAFAFVLPQGGAGWAMVRAAVLPRHRRRGIGTALLREVARHCVRQTRVADVRTISMAAWQPCPEATALAEKLGFEHERYFWMLERPRGSAVEPIWPREVECRIFDGSDAHLEAWNHAYNRSFAEHWRYVASTVEDCRDLSRAPGFRPDGIALAWLGGRCVGFCRCALLESRGEIEVLGTDPEVRGLGLGRALLRWGVRWIEHNSALPVTLLVDGANENALRLYRSEGFAPARERRVWGLDEEKLRRLVAP